MRSYNDAIITAFEDELIKIAGVTPLQKTLGLMAAGGITFETLRRANQDRRMGRAMRIQQGTF